MAYVEQHATNDTTPSAATLCDHFAATAAQRACEPALRTADGSGRRRRPRCSARRSPRRDARARGCHGPPSDRRGHRLSRPQDCQHLVDATLEAFGRVDILVNNAGLANAVPATRETPEQFRQVLAVNLDGCYWMAQSCGRTMQPGSARPPRPAGRALRRAGVPGQRRVPLHHRHHAARRRWLDDALTD